MKPLKLMTITAARILTAAHRLHAQLARVTTPTHLADTSRVTLDCGPKCRDAVAGAAFAINADTAKVGSASVLRGGLPSRGIDYLSYPRASAVASGFRIGP